MKKLVTALALTASFAAPALVPTAYASTFGTPQDIAAAVELEASTSAFYLDDIIIGVLEDDQAIASFCADATYDAIGHVTITDDALAMGSDLAVLEGAEISGFFFDAYEEDEKYSTSLGNQGDVVAIKQTYEKEEWLYVVYVGASEAPSFHVVIQPALTGWYVPELEADQSSMFHLVITGGPGLGC